MINFSCTRHKTLPHQPKRHQVAKVIRHSLVHKYSNITLIIQIVDNQTSQEINLNYRNIDKPTNVISLEYADSREKFNFLTGELFLSDDVIIHEASLQNKTIEAHYVHMLVHGLLHLQGYDHQTDDDALEMEALEIKILQSLGFDNPYLCYHEDL